MMKIKGYSNEFVSEMEMKHESSQDSACMFCWSPTVENECKSCGTVNNLDSDPFLVMSEELILS